MKCTDCGTEVKPVIAVDIDGTLGDYYSHFVEFANWYVGYHLPADYPGGMEFSEYLLLDKELYRDIKLAYRQGGMKRSMPAYEGAAGFMRWLKASGFEVWIATTRPYLRLDNIDPDTQSWLDRHNIEYDYMIYGEDKYEQLASRVDAGRVLGIIDDLHEQCVEALRYFSPAVIWQPERGHNAEQRWHRTFAYWDSLAGSLLALKEAWHED